MLLFLQKFGNDSSSGKRQKKALKYDTDEDEDGDESMKSDSEENRDEDAEEQEDDYDSGKEKARKKFPKVQESSSKKKTDRGSGYKTGHPKTISKSPVKKASSKISEEKESPDNSAKVFSRKRKPTEKGEKDITEKKSAGKFVTVISIPNCSLLLMFENLHLSSYCTTGSSFLSMSWLNRPSVLFFFAGE